MQHQYTRYTAAGNTFILMDGRTSTGHEPLARLYADVGAFVRRICVAPGGPGSDGLIVLDESPRGLPFRMQFYNPDGSTGMLCGNGSRCAVLAAADLAMITAPGSAFEVLGEQVTAELLQGDTVRVHFRPPVVIEPHRMLEHAIDGASLDVGYVDVGSQHVVVPFEALRLLTGAPSLETLDVSRIGALLRHHAALAPVGANANVIDLREDGEGPYLRIRTFERGVESETLACGTGCMSSSIIAMRRGMIAGPTVRLLTESGEMVRVTVQEAAPGGEITDLSLEGRVVRGERGLLTFDPVTGSLEVQTLAA